MGRGYIKNRPERPMQQASESQVQAMNAKLQARKESVLRKPPELSSPAAQSPQAKSELEWIWSADGWKADSTNGMYRIEAYVEEGARTASDGWTRYRCLQLAPKHEWWWQFTVKDTVQEAQIACDERYALRSKQ